jgi:hypothetical protein
MLREFATAWRVLASATIMLAIGAVIAFGRAAPVQPEPRNSDGTPQYVIPLPSSPGAVVLDYRDFGSQARAIDLLGHEWWSWEAGGSFEADDFFDVHVVVYRGRTLDDIERAYPTIEKLQDYRYVAYDDAMAWLDRNFDDLRDPMWGADYAGRMTLHFLMTRSRITTALGER